MPSLPAISIVIPTYNEAGRIAALLESLQDQNFAGLTEVFVVDGGSSDATVEIVRRFERVQLIEGGQGVSRQRNLGAQAATGELLIFLDGDDQPPASFLTQVASAFRKLPFAVACPWLFAYDGNWLTRAIYTGFNLGFWLGQSTLRMGSGVCLIAPRKAFLACGGFDENLHLGEDIQLIRKLCPRFGLHRHLLVPLGTSGRRFEHEGAAKLLWFYARITPLLLLGCWKALQRLPYSAAPYKVVRKGKG